MNWELLQSFVVDGNTQEFLEQVAESLQTGNKQFGILQEGLRTQCFQQVNLRYFCSIYSTACAVLWTCISCNCRCQTLLLGTLCAKPC